MEKEPLTKKKLHKVNARQLAVECLVAWERQSPDKRLPLNNLASDFLNKHNISIVERRLFWELVVGCVRWLRLLDYHVGLHLKKSKSSLPILVRNWLRVGAYQLLFLEKIPPSAAVNETVKGLKKSKARWASGLANAVLRKIAVIREKEGMEAARKVPGPIRSPAKKISIETSHPEWMVKRWIERYGQNRAQLLCRVNNSRPPLTLRTNTLKCTRDEVIALLHEEGLKPRPGKMSREAVIIEADHISITELPGFSKGLFQVQDESSQLVSHLLAPKPGEKVLDLCAGLGGKTTHMAALMKNMGTIIATDTNSKRLALLRENCKRLGVKNVLNKKLNEIEKEAPFDKILVDAPCTGIGVIRRHPDIKWNRSPESIDRMAKIQLSLLDQAAELLKPGGWVAYSVCSIEPEEGQGVIESFVRGSGNWNVLSADEIMPEIEKGPFLKLLPQAKGPDGFFAALIEKVD